MSSIFIRAYGVKLIPLSERVAMVRHAYDQGVRYFDTARVYGESESIVLGAGNPHHQPTPSNEPELRSVPFTMTIDKQEGRRFSGTFSSPRSTTKVIAVISRTGAILMADDFGYTHGTVLAPNRIELCYIHVSSAARIASCTELTKQP